MAEAALSHAISSITANLASSAFKNIVNLWGVGNEFEKLNETMSALEAVILDAEAKQVHSHEVKYWLRRFEDAVYDLDNLLDVFHTEDLTRKVMMMPDRNEMVKMVRIFFSSSNQFVFRVKMYVKIKEIRWTLDNIKADRTFGSLVPLPQDAHFSSVPRDSYSFVREEEVIGRDDDKSKIIQLLFGSHDHFHEDNVSVLPIVGMGGLGKTTLAQFVFNDEMVRKYFELQMWVCVSDMFDLKSILEKIFRSSDGSVEQGLDINQLQNSLRKKLEGKRYLLVLDDMWNEDRKKWLQLKSFLIDGSRGSAVLITTRSEMVAHVTRTIESYYLQGLDRDKSWSLFKKMAFQRGEEPCNSNIVKIGKEILEKCKGVPLAISTIGSILYGKNLDSDWLNFKKNELAILPHQQNDILATLRLSYNCLPSHLKHCFAYCRLFPKDHLIDVQKLIKIWIAQGFVKSSNESEYLEDIGYGYLIDLLWRSFFQEVRKDDLGTIRYCKMHDLVHDLQFQLQGNAAS